MQNMQNSIRGINYKLEIQIRFGDNTFVIYVSFFQIKI
jgi:hypothetical protein